MDDDDDVIPSTYYSVQVFSCFYHHNIIEVTFAFGFVHPSMTHASSFVQKETVSKNPFMYVPTYQMSL